MAGSMENGAGRRGSRWAVAIWGAAALALLLPLVAMQITDEVVWELADFAVAAVLLFGAALAYDLLAKKADNIAYRAAVGVAVATALLLVWINLAVGIVGNEENLANLMYVAVLALAVLGAIIGRFQPHGMARALIATAFAQALVAMIAGIAGMGYPASPPLEIFGVNALFAALWLISAWLFEKAAAREQSLRNAAP